MPFAYMLQQLESGKAGQTPRMAGYIKKTVASGSTDGSYILTWVNRAGTETAYNVAADGTITCTSPLSLDTELFGELMKTDWTVGSTSDLESARSGTGHTW